MKSIYSFFIGRTGRLFLFLFLSTEIVSLAQLPSDGKTKKISITIDDLPISTNVNYSIVKYREIFLSGLDQLKKEKVPIIGFVNESFLYSNGREEKRRSSLLADWLDAGMDLGNHTFSHADANKLPVDKYIEDIKKGELICSALQQARGKKMKYFRYPYLRTGITVDGKNAIEKYLEKSGYIIAPATITSSAEMIYAEAYRTLLKNKDATLLNKATQEYLNILSERITLGEKQSVNLFRREISQILILHNTEINNDNWKNIISMIRNKGYSIVSLEEALEDEAYQIKDNYIDHGGMDWLSRWAKAKGVSNSLFSGRQPEASDWVKKLSSGETGY
jgi:peptidoglycan/xylan/chitin deacetylase (PgdA/CDA1 family)